MKNKPSLKKLSLKKLTISKLNSSSTIQGGSGVCDSGICAASTAVNCPSFPNRCPPPPSYKGSCSCDC
ncbi:hypothetical protein [Dokdonia sp.]|uniref:hypothetical protein n=1 Tax=Dokdonia sp. TaxID=2024995 RepID=UPI003264113A